MWFLIVFTLFTHNTHADPQVDTIYGTVRGTTKTYKDDRTYEEYLGIPFAEPPTGDNRFRRPMKSEPWDGVKDVKEYGSHCIQYPPKPFTKDGLSNVTSEDCLFLNVFVPGENRTGDDLAVVVYVHGGGYYQGTGALYPGAELALHGDILVVTFNYRLGPLGFLSTEDDVIPGNMALWDTKLALEWVSENIAAFGGDVNRVNVFGMSAGAAITSHLMVSPQTNSLITRGASLSGASSGPFGVAQPGAVANSTQLLARVLGCDTSMPEVMIECLREKDPNDISYWGFVAVVTVKRQSYNFIPVIDGDFIPVDPSEMWREGWATNKDLIIGSAVHEGGRIVMPNLQGEANHTFNVAENDAQINRVLTFSTNQYPGNTSDMIKAIFLQYPGLESNDITKKTQTLVDVFTEAYYKSAAHFEAAQHSKLIHNMSTSTYMYNYAYSNSVLVPSRNIDHTWIVAEHADDQHSLFGSEFREYFFRNEWDMVANEDDVAMSDTYMSYFSNFANNGNPNIGLEVPVFWEEYSHDEHKVYLEISQQPKMKLETSNMTENYRFWRHDFNDIAFPADEEITATEEFIEDQQEYTFEEETEEWLMFLEQNEFI